MATTQTVPTAKAILTQKTGFDLESKSDVLVVKIGSLAPITSMQDFVSRLGNDSQTILKVINDGMEAYEAERLRADSSVPWQTEEEDENGETVLTPFEGNLISEENGKKLAVNVLNIAKLMFGYPASKLPKDAPASVKSETKALKQVAKLKAQEMLLSNPAVVEALK